MILNKIKNLYFKITNKLFPKLALKRQQKEAKAQAKVFNSKSRQERRAIQRQRAKHMSHPSYHAKGTPRKHRRKVAKMTASYMVAKVRGGYVN